MPSTWTSTGRRRELAIPQLRTEYPDSEEKPELFLGTQDRLRSNFQKMGLTGYHGFPRITLKTNFPDPVHLPN